VSSLVAWVGALTYTLQLYFDFSGYSDMALGLGCIFGLKLPLNFNSPFKQTSISDFWRCWHMTMTRFFTTFIYTPLAMQGMRRSLGGQSGRIMRFVRVGAVPAVVTFFVAGVWHGSGMTFVAYGILHGLAIAANLTWREFAKIELPAVVGWCLTMAVVVTGLVIFRAPDMTTATGILSAMWTGSMSAGPTSAVVIDISTAMALILLLGSILLLMPNAQTIMGNAWVSSDQKPADTVHQAGLLAWRPTIPAAFFTAALCFAAIASIGATSTFLYYQF
jgi:alginate O-acetyltransferase complex protein AlgI